MATPIETNSEGLQRILQAVNSLPDAGSSGVAIQTKTGSFTWNGASGEMEINCGFVPDVVFIHLPDPYTEDSELYVNDMAANVAAIDLGEYICCWSCIGELYDDTFTFAFCYIGKAENGFIASSFGEQDLSGEYWYTTKTYNYTAIKYT